MVAKGKPVKYDEWEVKQDLQCLINAQEIKDDKPRYEAAMKLHEEKYSAMKSLKAEYVEDSMEEDE